MRMHQMPYMEPMGQYMQPMGPFMGPGSSMPMHDGFFQPLCAMAPNRRPPNQRYFRWKKWKKQKKKKKKIDVK